MSASLHRFAFSYPVRYSTPVSILHVLLLSSNGGEINRLVHSNFALPALPPLGETIKYVDKAIRKHRIKRLFSHDR